MLYLNFEKKSLRYYLEIQWLRFIRWMKEMGVQPIIGIILMVIGFILSSWYVFYKLPYASWIYVGICIYFVSRLGSKGRNDELKRMSGRLVYRKIRMLENVLGVSPFVIYLLYERAMWEALVCLLLGVGISFIVRRVFLVRAIPTPFSRLPFEGIAGFRRVFFVFMLLYFVAIMGMRVGNYNLALVALAATYLVQLSFYLKPEKSYFVWIYSLDRKAFLMQKCQFALVISWCISLPLAALLIIFFSQQWLMILLVILLGHLWLIAAVVGKYGVYPKEMNVAQAFLFAFAIIVFPLLLVFIPLYIKQAREKLRLYLK